MAEAALSLVVIGGLILCVTPQAIADAGVIEERRFPGVGGVTRRTLALEVVDGFLLEVAPHAIRETGVVERRRFPS